MLQIPPTHNLHTTRAATRHKHGRTASRHRGTEKSVAPTDFSAPLCRITYRIRQNRLRGSGGEVCKMYAGECKILWNHLTLLKSLYINLLRTKSVRWQKKHTLFFTSRQTGRKQIFVYKLYTFFDGCNALVLPLQHFCTNPNCIGDEVRRLWRSMKFAANAENIRTKGHKNIRTKELQDIRAWTCVHVSSRT